MLITNVTTPHNQLVPLSMVGKVPTQMPEEIVDILANPKYKKISLAPVMRAGPTNAKTDTGRIEAESDFIAVSMRASPALRHAYSLLLDNIFEFDGFNTLYNAQFPNETERESAFGVTAELSSACVDRLPKTNPRPVAYFVEKEPKHPFANRVHLIFHKNQLGALAQCHLNHQRQINAMRNHDMGCLALGGVATVISLGAAYAALRYIPFLSGVVMMTGGVTLGTDRKNKTSQKIGAAIAIVGLLLCIGSRSSAPPQNTSAPAAPSPTPTPAIKTVLANSNGPQYVLSHTAPNQRALTG